MKPLIPSPLLHSIAFAVLAWISTVVAAQGAGVVMAVTGKVTAIDAQGQERVLAKGGEVRSGDRIVTADGALAQLRMADGGYLSVRSGTEMQLDKFVHDTQDAKNSNFLVSLIKGGFRSITGLIGRANPDSYQIRTPTATIGVRGTDHEPMFIPAGVPGMAALGAPGVYDKVNQGETFIRNERGVLSLTPGQVGFAPIRPDTAPRALPKVPEFYKTELKVDLSSARGKDDDAPPAAEKPAAVSGAKLRPSLGARVAAEARVGDATAIDKPATIGVVKSLDGAAALRTLDGTTAIKTLDGTTAIKTLEGSTAIKTLDPVGATAPVSSTLTNAIAPATATISPTTSAVLSPTVAPAISTATVISPTVSPTISPTVSTIISPTLSTTTISPTLSTTISPTLTTTIAPTTAIVAPTTTTTTSSTLLSPILSAPLIKR